MLGGITLVLYGMIGLLGAKIWKENNVDFANPVNLVPVGGRASCLGDRQRPVLRSPTTSSSAASRLGTLMVVLGYHVARVVAP